MRRLGTKRGVVAGVAALALAGAAVAAYAAFARGATATAPSSVRALGDAGLPPAVEQAVASAAAKAGVRASDVRQVAVRAAGDEHVGVYDSAGLYVGRNGRGQELVAFFSPTSFTSFADARKVARINGGVFASAASQPDAAGGPTGHVQLRGVAEPAVQRVEIERADGKAVDVELARVSPGGFSYFTYVSDDPATFPHLVRAFGPSGEKIAEQDVSEDIKPPT